jgi:hypothetical protein
MKTSKDATMPDSNTLTLNDNQAALVLETNDDGEITVNLHSGSVEFTFAAALCEAIAEKLVSDEQFQQEMMDRIDGGEEE